MGNEFLPDIPIPPSWPEPVRVPTAACPSLIGTYSNVGEKVSGNESREILFARGILSQAMPNGDIPNSLKIRQEEGRSNLTIELLGSGSFEVSKSYKCEGGWVVIDKEDGEQHLGDGVDQIKYIQRHKLTRATDNSLIVHSYIYLKSQMKPFPSGVTEGYYWSRFLSTEMQHDENT